MTSNLGNKYGSAARSARQGGVALVVALVLLVITTLIALSASRFTVLEVRQSSNFETVIEAQQSAQSVVDAVVSTLEINVVAGAVGDVNCTNTTGLSGCTTKTIVLPGNLYSAQIASGQVWGKTQRLAPLLRNIRGSRGTGSSIVDFKAASFNVSSNYDRTADRLSRAGVDQGYLVPIAVGGGQ